MPDSLLHPRILLWSMAIVCALGGNLLAQQPRLPQLPAPPPMRFVSPEERSQLETSKNPKSRVQTTLELADGHLAKAESFATQKEFDQASEELGRYWGLLDDAHHFLLELNNKKNSIRDLYRHVDIALRKLIPRLAVMRRETPVEYSGRFKEAEEFTRNLRSEILDTFYGQSTLREPTTDEKKNDEVKGSTDGARHP